MSDHHSHRHKQLHLSESMDNDNLGARLHISDSSSESHNQSSTFHRKYNRRVGRDEEFVEEEIIGKHTSSANHKSSSHVVTGFNPKKTRPVGCELTGTGSKVRPERIRPGGCKLIGTGSRIRPGGCKVVGNDDEEDEEEEDVYGDDQEEKNEGDDYEKVELGCGGQIKPKREIKHFGHPGHALCQSNAGYNLCEICQTHIVGNGYICKEGCNFYIHLACIDLPREIKHELYPGHTLKLLPHTNVRNELGQREFHCKGCKPGSGLGFLYSNCSYPKIDLHVKCAGAPLTLELPKLCSYPLVLSCAFQPGPLDSVYCNICQNSRRNGSWVYFAKETDFVAHTYCAINSAVERGVAMGVKRRLETMKIQ